MEQISRRQALTFAAASCAACVLCGTAEAQDKPKDAPGAGGNNNQPKGPPPKEINIGKLSDFAKPGFYDKFVASQIIVANVDNQLVAISARCTHKGAIVKLKDDKTLRCPVHKAEFAEHGQPTSGPAKVALNRYALKAGADGNIIVDTTKVFPEKEWEKPEAFIVIPKV